MSNLWSVPPPHYKPLDIVSHPTYGPCMIVQHGGIMTPHFYAISLKDMLCRHDVYPNSGLKVIGKMEMPDAG
jgi:hypothetical protein